jgi:hypothetical protein
MNDRKTSNNHEGNLSLIFLGVNTPFLAKNDDEKQCNESHKEHYSSSNAALFSTRKLIAGSYKNENEQLTTILHKKPKKPPNTSVS